MRSWIKPVGMLVVLGGLAAMSSSHAMADSVAFKAELAGSNESPPNDSAAKGTADAKFNTDSKLLEWTVVYSDLSGPAMGAHIHGPAEAGNNAGIMLPFASADSPITGSATLTDAQVGELTAGRLYVNVHTKAHPGGEIRGQLIKAQ